MIIGGEVVPSVPLSHPLSSPKLSSMTRRLLLCSLPVILIGVFCVAAFLPSPADDTPTYATLKLVKPGMTKGEIEALLGAPPREEGSIWIWHVGRATVRVPFDETGRSTVQTSVEVKIPYTKQFLNLYRTWRSNLRRNRGI
jgi:hypothetical protein